MKSSKHRILAASPILPEANKSKDKTPPAVSKYEWIEVKPNETALNYLGSFMGSHVGASIDYNALDIPKSDPNSDSQHGRRFDVGSIHTRLSKWGGLSLETKKNKKDKEDYDLNDSFIDDSEGNVPGGHNPGYIEAVFEDFICMTGDLKSFKKSTYYRERDQTTKKSINQENKKKKSPRKKSEPSSQKPAEKVEKKEKAEKKKRVTKRKRSSTHSGIERPESELKTPKDESDHKGLNIGDDEYKEVHIKLV